jgi:hypothetical protein
VPEEVVWLALDQLKKENLLENGGEIPTKFSGMSRREVIRKVGLATAIALPVIAGLVAPTAAQAQSIIPCIYDSECPPTGSPCVIAVCIYSVCATQPAPYGTPANGGLCCDGAGGTIDICIV